MSVGSFGTYDVKPRGQGSAEHRGCDFIVLDISHDKAARDAAVTFLQGLYYGGDKSRALGIRAMLDETAGQFQEHQDSQRRGARKGS